MASADQLGWAGKEGCSAPWRCAAGEESTPASRRTRRAQPGHTPPIKCSHPPPVSDLQFWGQQDAPDTPDDNTPDENLPDEGADWSDPNNCATMAGIQSKKCWCVRLGRGRLGGAMCFLASQGVPTETPLLRFARCPLRARWSARHGFWSARQLAHGTLAPHPSCLSAQPEEGQGRGG